MRRYFSWRKKKGKIMRTKVYICSQNANLKEWFLIHDEKWKNVGRHGKLETFFRKYMRDLDGL